MLGTIKSVEPKITEHDRNAYTFVVRVEVRGRSLSVTVPAQVLFDQTSFAVCVAHNHGYLMQEEADWRKALAAAWQEPEPKEDDGLFDE